MKPLLKIAALFLMQGLILLSCKKETLPARNKAPVANAGIAQTIAWPADSSQLDGSASTDADGIITSYKWTQISGPSLSLISTPSQSKTIVKYLALGLYVFELTVTDNEGYSSKNSVEIAFISRDPCAPREYDLDLSTTGKYIITQEYIDTWDYPSGEIFNLIQISAKAILPSGESFNIGISEYADTATLDTLFSSSFQIYKTSNNKTLKVLGDCSVNFKKLVHSGGGIFSGILTVTSGSASECYPNGFSSTFPPLTFTGTIDTLSHVDLHIKGKVYF
jgi:hypothetical protein